MLNFSYKIINIGHLTQPILGPNILFSNLFPNTFTPQFWTFLISHLHSYFHVSTSSSASFQILVVLFHYANVRREESYCRIALVVNTYLPFHGLVANR